MNKSQKEMGMFFDIHHRTDIPRRTDKADLLSYKNDIR